MDMDFMTFYKYLIAKGASHDRAQIFELRAELSVIRTLVLAGKTARNKEEYEKMLSIERRRAIAWVEKAGEDEKKPIPWDEYFGPEWK
jgi:hypothetical protein